MAFSYCEFVARPGAPEMHRAYHHAEYGFPSTDESVLFERLVLEIFQAGLSWETILKKREGFRTAFEGFDTSRIAAYGESDIERLVNDASIIRNRKKIEAVIANANVVVGFGSFGNWLDSHHPLSREDWVKLFKKTFKFTGPEIVNEFLTSLGYLPDAHEESCPTYAEIAKLNPPWMRVK